ncbi:hypothetical protein ABTK05_21020, partial [Acinetobacter baumannii]
YATAETGGGYASSWSNSLPLLTSSTVGGASVAASVTVAAATPAAAVTVSHTASADGAAPGGEVSLALPQDVMHEPAAAKTGTST